VIILDFLVEVVKFIIYSLAIVLISKYILTGTIRRIAQTLKLSSKTVGDIAGYATSVPELLTVAVSNMNGLIGASMYNILSSNIINFLQYIASVVINKNQKLLKNSVIKVDIILVIATILLPIIFIELNLEINIVTVIIFIILYVLFRYIDGNAHKLYLSSENGNVRIVTAKREWWKSIKYIMFLLVSSILLFVIGDLLGETLETLRYRLNIPEVIIGVLLGIITSIPELITFFEAQRHHKESDDEVEGVIEATNNLFTSNVLNLFVIQSIGVLLYIIVA
jgi:Ca2+/Na+ antiporter